MRRVSKQAAVLAVLAVALTAARAAAEPKWSKVAETPMTGIGSYVFQSVGLAPGGGTLVGGTTVTVDGRVPAVIERPARSAAWTAPIPLAAPSRFDVGPLVARNARGDGLAVWGAAGEPLVAAVRPAGRPWSARAAGIKLPALRTGRAGDTLKIALSASGVARIGIAACGGRGCLLTVLRRSVRTAKWARAKPSRLPAAATATLDWGLSENGHLVAAWIRPAPLGVRAIVLRPADTTPPREQSIARGAAAGPVDVEVGARGEGAVSWTGVVGTMQTSVRLPSDTRWRGSRGIIREAGANGGRIGLGCDGSLVATWVEPGDQVRATTAAGPGGPFAKPSKVGIYGAMSKPVAVGAGVAAVAGVVTWARADQESAGMAIARIGDPDDAFHGQNPDFGFRDSPAPVFAGDGFGIVVGAGENTLRVQEIEPDPERLQCAR